MIMKGVTSTGFLFEVADDVLDDYELLEVLVRVDKGSIQDITEMVHMMLGEDQEKRLKDHIRTLHGKISITHMMDEVEEILGASNESKN